MINTLKVFLPLVDLCNDLVKKIVKLVLQLLLGGLLLVFFLNRIKAYQRLRIALAFLIDS
jgi:hypothetical protein